MSGLQIFTDNFLGIPLYQNWWVLFYFVGAIFIFNILAEELFWRGYILPRQELAQGRFAWIAHGILWGLFHIFYHQSLWTLIAYLPITLSIPFVAQKTKNTWPGIIVHMIVNSMTIPNIVKGIIG